MKTLAGSHPGHRPRARLDIYAFARSQRMHIVCPGMPLAALWWGWATTDRPSQANWCVALAHMAGSDIQHDEWPRRSRGRSSCCMSRYLPEQPSQRCISTYSDLQRVLYLCDCESVHSVQIGSGEQGREGG
jgi:hypothetical protein